MLARKQLTHNAYALTANLTDSQPLGDVDAAQGNTLVLMIEYITGTEDNAIFTVEHLGGSGQYHTPYRETAGTWAPEPTQTIVAGGSALTKRARVVIENVASSVRIRFAKTGAGTGGTVTCWAHVLTPRG